MNQLGNLPASLTSFVGRQTELRELCTLLSRGTERLVTLTGAGGVGKTRLALEVAAELQSRGLFEDGVWLIELAPLREPLRLAQLVALVFGLHEEPGRPFGDVLLDALRPRHLLLVLDNCEHLALAATELAHAILRASPEVFILATSREPLGLIGETVRGVAPLAWPDPRALPALEQLRACDAVRLFEERATAASAEFRMSHASAPAVAQICARLDGMPLALELAAARVRALTVQQIAERLDDRFQLLAGGNSAAAPRQRTLEATVAWSYDLLNAAEQRLFRRLAVFAGGWTLEDAENVCGEPGVSVMLVLARLVEKSLVLADDGPEGQKWYRFLETIRQFAAERLRASDDELAMTHARHLGWYVSLSQTADEHVRWRLGLPWGARMLWLTRLSWEYANLRVAYQWAAATDERLDDALRLVSGLFGLYWTTGYLSEGRDWLADLLARSADASSSRTRAWALSCAAKLAGHQGDDEAGVRYAREYLALPTHSRSGAGNAHAHTALGVAALRAGDVSTARHHASIAEAEARVGDEFAVPIYLTYIGAAALADGQIEESRRVYEQALSEARAVDFRLALGVALEGLGGIARVEQDYRRARSLYLEALETLRAIGDMPQVALALIALGKLSLEEGDRRQARRYFGDGLQLATHLAHHESLIAALEGIALAVERPTPRTRKASERAISLREAAAKLREASRSCSAARVPLERAVAEAQLALAELEPPTDGASNAGGLSLSPREREVAELVAGGCSNRAIADSLVIGTRTAEMHVSRLLAKVGVDSRAQLAVWAIANGITARVP
ncbi:MAG TPA: LuxR C-terminal-related transcriptional regulator [Chloroflexota bacterium]